MNGKRDDEARLDELGEESFPASDPPSTTPTLGPARGTLRPSGAAADDEEHRSKGNPTDDRLAAETASARVQGLHPPETDHR